MRFLHGLLLHYVQTTVHKYWVAYYIFKLVVPLVHRAIIHDLSKYKWDEAKLFAEVVFDLRSTTYGTDEYRELLRRIKPSIEKHYARNSHHPEHYEAGLLGMQGLDLIEMVADWSAAVKRHADGDLQSSIEKNGGRFNYGSESEWWITSIAEDMDALDGRSV